MNRSSLYWFAAVALVVFGLVGLLTIGVPFLLFGLAMIVLGRWRSRNDVIVPALAAVVAFLVGYVLLAPISCSTSSGMDAVTVCRYLVVGRWTSSGTPSLLPGVIGGLGLATAVAVILRRLLHRPARVA